MQRRGARNGVLPGRFDPTITWKPTIWRVDPWLIASTRAVKRGTTRAALIYCAAAVTAFAAAPAAAQTEGSSGVIGSGEPTTFAREDTFESARGLGMGSGVRASAAATSALAYNPANLALARAYHIEAFSSIVTSERSWTIGTAVTDSVSSKVAMGTSFRGSFGDDTREYKGWDWRSGVGIALIPQLSIGVGLRWAKLRARTDENGERLGPRLRGFSMDAAISATPIKWLHIAALGYNLINLDSPLAPQMVGGSVALAPVEGLDIGTDILADLSTFEDPELVLGGGAEYVIAKQVPVRLGYRRDVGRDLHQITTSVGFVRSKFGLEFALRQDLGNTDETHLLFTVRYQVR